MASLTQRLLLMETYRLQEPDRIILAMRFEPGATASTVRTSTGRDRPGDWDAFVHVPGDAPTS